MDLMSMIQQYQQNMSDIDKQRELEAQTLVSKELSNKPRYDLDGSRYGNTLSDDMFSIKNPNYQGHTPESYDYFRDKIPALEEEYQDPFKKLKFMREGLNLDPLMGRQKTYGEGVGVELWHEPSMETPVGSAVPEMGHLDSLLNNEALEDGEIMPQELQGLLEAVRGYHQWQDQTSDLGTESLRGDKLGREHTDDMYPRYGAEYDPQTGAYVDFNALSPAQIEQLYKMGVKGQEYVKGENIEEENARRTLNNLLEMYKYRLENP